jgi:outer membrane receptor protein involved in Fe transport
MAGRATYTSSQKKGDKQMRKFANKPGLTSIGRLSALLVALASSVHGASAQETESRTLAVEEIIVTAQRREQSFQEVPIAIEVYTGEEIRRQGFRDMDDLANFSPTVLIEPRTQTQDISIRGFGTTGNALTLDQAAPTFIDGIHFGRSSQIKLAFMDVQSVEVLKGPQPVYFGQNATAGAFNIRSRRPTDTWEGYINAEVGSNKAQELTFGIGGPLADRWGIRVAGTRETSEGYMDNVVTGESLGGYENTGGRVILQYEPSDRLSVTGKVGVSRIRADTEVTSLCRTAGPLIYGRGGPTDDPGEAPGDELSVWGEPPVGTAWDVPFEALDTDCFSSDRGVTQGGPYFEPPQTVREENSDFGSVDIREAAAGFAPTGGNNGIMGYEDIDAVNSYIDVAYDLNDSVSAEWLTGFASYERDYVQENRNSPFLMNFQGRGEDFDQWSTELRFTSTSGGPIEWNAGAFYQSTDLDGFSSSLRANVRQSQRYNFVTEEVDFAAVFGVLTFNFLNDRMSLDVGGRYQDVDKFATVEGYAASWVFAECPEDPCDPLSVPSDLVFDPAIDGYHGDAGEVDGDAYYLVDPATARLYVPVAPGTQLYAMPFRESRNVPVPWLPGNATPVGLTAPDYAFRVDAGEGPWAESFTVSGFSPQITLRYRPTDDMSIYARYAESTKVGGFDTGQTSIPSSLEELTYDTEDAEQMEIGVKGSLFDGRVRYDADIFNLEFPNLQSRAVSPDPNQETASVNVGQRVRGLEFSMNMAVSENLLLGFGGAFMDGEMTSYPGAGCTPAERTAGVGNADSACRFFRPEDVNGEEELVQFTPTTPLEAADAPVALIDRTGSEAPRTPDWKFILSADYVRQVSTDFEFLFNAKGYVSDGYILDGTAFDQTVKYNQHGDLNLLVGMRNVRDNWSVMLFARNLFEARPSYNAEFDTVPNGLEAAYLAPSAFTSYGVQLEYLIN